MDLRLGLGLVLSEPMPLHWELQACFSGVSPPRQKKVELRYLPSPGQADADKPRQVRRRLTGFPKGRPREEHRAPGQLRAFSAPWQDAGDPVSCPSSSCILDASPNMPS